ncbi:hypothetical protein HOL21_03795 [Candidatus Woesearchaeota archaeon]|jgi:hypothetical protein|nr:hypothetical protein [Candidatus Woesearchaeota archaeon]MBT5397308.1 hypothetical protein [Candidatus Woesearchaeota archaeon]MBT5924449.1 hypothetical protein [Candidatus Woesearchaeota archaeon]MBT6367847.1 hypothetical protein [Candidatus Woesearchaeota archaeon]MBT7762708.1 hypothetical protein [Candidatus Woesearchaeota archaeon]
MQKVPLEKLVHNELCTLAEQVKDMEIDQISFWNPTTSRQISVNRNNDGRDITVKVEDGFSHLYTVRVMTGAHLEQAYEEFITKIFGKTKVENNGYRIKAPKIVRVGKNVVYTKEGLTVYAGNSQRINRFCKNKKEVYIALGSKGTERLSDKEMTYLKLQPWLKTEGTHENRRTIVEHLTLLPELVYDKIKPKQATPS